MKKLLSLLLCAAMLFCLLPLEVRAASGAWDGTVDISWYDPEKAEYEIDTPAKLAGLAALVNGMADPTAKAIVGNKAYLVSKKGDNVLLVGAGGGNVSDTVYTGGVDFAYKTIYLTADLDMGGRKKHRRQLDRPQLDAHRRQIPHEARRSRRRLHDARHALQPRA